MVKLSQGKCLCGESTVDLKGDFDSQILCHCSDCKETSGSAFSTNILAKIAETTISGPNVKEFGVKAPSGNIVTRVFCGKCGSALAHKTPAFGDAMAVQTGNFRDAGKLPIGLELFTKDRWSAIPAIQGAAQQ